MPATCDRLRSHPPVASAASRANGVPAGQKIAVIGSGISGSLVARLLCNEHDVRLFEANQYLGGHTHSVDLHVFGQNYSLDTGFMVFNRRTYPNFCRMLGLLGVPSQASDMSFSVRCDQTGLEYQGSSLKGLFARRSNLLRPWFYGMLKDIVRFNRYCRRAIEEGELNDETSFGDFLAGCGLGGAFGDYYLLPMTAAIWSSKPERILDFPARFLVGFLYNHGLLQTWDRPQWRTIPGGARRYLESLVAPLKDRVHVGCPIQSVTRASDHVDVQTALGESEQFDQVVLATHADQSLDLLSDATPNERDVLGAFPYQTNEAVLHTDISSLPSRPAARASWNYRIRRPRKGSVSVTYDLSRLQNHASPSPILLTLNPAGEIARDSVIRRFHFAHPSFSRRSRAAQARHAQVNGVRRTYFCGAYWGYGFHEDGVNSALAVARYFGKTLDSCIAVSTRVTYPTGATAR